MARDRLVEFETQLLQCNEDLDLAKQKLNEFISSVSDNNEREVELQRQVSQLQHEVKRLTGELATLEAKLKALSSKVFFYIFPLVLIIVFFNLAFKITPL